MLDCEFLSATATVCVQSVPTTPFWRTLAGPVVGSALAGVVALATFFLTRRHDRRQFREQVGLDAAARLAESALSVANVLEVDPVDGASSFDEWLEHYLTTVSSYRYRVAIDGPVLPEGTLREAMFDSAEWLTGGLIHKIGTLEASALGNGDPLPAALQPLLAEQHELFTDVVRDLTRWRIHGAVNAAPVAARLAGLIQENPAGPLRI